MKHIKTYQIFESAKTKGAAVVIVVDERALILRRGLDAPWNPGMWNLPGGITESGETPEECASREAVEECNLEPTGMEYVSSHGQDDWVMDFFKASGYNGEIKMSYECIDHAWVDVTDLKKYEFVPFVEEVVKKVLNG